MSRLPMSLVVAAVLVPEIASAQTSPGTADVIALPPVSVTARKREEDAKDVPFALTARDGQALEDARIRDTQGLFRVVPNMGLNTFNDGRTTYYSIRGVGPLSQPLSPDDTSVVTYVDGIPQPIFGSDVSFLDLERVEVLRGPQGTLFGRSTSAGAINITTRKPTDTPEFGLRGEFGGQGTRLAEGTASGPLIKDRLGGRLAVKYWGADGHVPNLYSDDRGQYDNYAARGSVVLTPSDRTKFTLGFFGERDNGEPTGLVLRQSANFPSLASTEYSIDRDVAGTGLTMSHDLDWATLSAVAGFNRVKTKLNTDDTEGLTFNALFGLPVQFFQAKTDFSDWRERENTFSQELRLNSQPDAKIAWVAGLHYFFEDFDVRYVNQSAFFATTNGTRDVALTNNSTSAFGEVTVPVVDKLKATGGLRYSYDWKDYDSRFTGNGFPGTVASFQESGDLTYSYVTGRASLSYEFVPQSNVYGTVARGYKTGGFPRFPNDAAAGQPTQPYQPATNWSYEIGSKNVLFGGRAHVNVAAFFNAVKDEQLYAFDPGSFTFRPANVDVRSYGVEMESGVRLARGLDLVGTIGFTEASLRNVSTALAAATGAADGNDVPNVPKLGGSLALQYRAGGDVIGLPQDIGLLGRIETQYQGSRYADVGNRLRLASYSVVNARLGIDADRGELYLFAANLFDKEFELGGNHIAAGIDTVQPARGRIVGVGAAIRF